MKVDIFLSWIEISSGNRNLVSFLEKPKKGKWEKISHVKEKLELRWSSLILSARCFRSNVLHLIFPPTYCTLLKQTLFYRFIHQKYLSLLFRLFFDSQTFCNPRPKLSTVYFSCPEKQLLHISSPEDFFGEVFCLGGFCFFKFETNNVLGVLQK